MTEEVLTAQQGGTNVLSDSDNGAGNLSGTYSAGGSARHGRDVLSVNENYVFIFNGLTGVSIIVTFDEDTVTITETKRDSSGNTRTKVYSGYGGAFGTGATYVLNRSTTYTALNDVFKAIMNMADGSEITIGNLEKLTFGDFFEGLSILSRYNIET